MQKIVKFIPAAIGLALVLLGTACNTSSDSSRILESDNISLRATISYYQNLDPTMTANASTFAQQMATTQADLDRSRQEVKSLTIRLNNAAQGGAPVVANTPDNQAALNTVEPVSSGGASDGFGSVPTATPTQMQASAPVATAAPGTPVSVRSSSGLSMEQIMTSKDKDDNGCTTQAASIFSTVDTQIVVGAVMRNYKSGTTFVAKWAGDGFEHENDWTADKAGKQTCVYFYVEPRTLQMKPGSYTVVLSATDGSNTVVSPAIPFTIQQQ
jgi:hypothetical protein